jgi:aryl-alcohol dehydrogenase-like predicted oxidoreductase
VNTPTPINIADIEIGLGTSSWGDSLLWDFGRSHSEVDLRASFEQVISRNNVLIDTAEIYGAGKSEAYIGKFSQQTASNPLIASKFFPFPWRITHNTLLNALRRSLHRLKASQVYLYQIHWDLPPTPIATWVKGLAQASEEGLIRHVGVSNYGTQQMLQAHDLLAQFGLRLASNQVRYSLLDRRIEFSGILDLARELSVRVIAYSPLEQGLLTGKYTSTNPPRGFRRLRYRTLLDAVQPLVSTMRDIGRAYAENGIVKTPAQVALNWCICKGTLPIPGAKNVRQAQHNLTASGWRLANDDVAILDRLSTEFHQQTKRTAIR